MYLQAAANAAAKSGPAGKPMAKMLQSMAMLHQAQQQQAILAGLPKRGRGSRGGGLGLAKKAGIAIKLKRLERQD